MMLKKKYVRRFSLLLIALGPLTLVVQADTTIGRWCDKALPTMPQYNSILKIVVTRDGDAEMRTRFADGSRTVTKLRKEDRGIYVAIGSRSGDKYRIEPDGSLHLLDNDGLVRVATRLANTPEPGDCGM